MCDPERADSLDHMVLPDREVACKEIASHAVKMFELHGITSVTDITHYMSQAFILNEEGKDKS